MNLEAIYRQDLEQMVASEDKKHALILSLLGIICAYAAKQQRHYYDYMEIVSIGNFVLVEHAEEAMQHTNPAGYLLKTAWHEMNQYRRHDLVIKPPTTPGDDPYIVKSLVVGEYDEEEQYVDPPQCAQDETEWSVLYAALAQLPPNGQMLLCRAYGLLGYGEELLSEIAGGDSTTKVYGAAKARKLWHLKALRKKVEEQYPDFVQQHTRQTKKQSDLKDLRIPEVTRLKLQVAEQTLRAQGKSLSMNKLRMLSGVHTRYATAYLQQGGDA